MPAFGKAHSVLGDLALPVSEPFALPPQDAAAINAPPCPGPRMLPAVSVLGQGAAATAASWAPEEVAALARPLASCRRRGNK